MKIKLIVLYLSLISLVLLPKTVLSQNLQDSIRKSLVTDSIPEEFINLCADCFIRINAISDDKDSCEKENTKNVLKLHEANYELKSNKKSLRNSRSGFVISFLLNLYFIIAN